MLLDMCQKAPFLNNSVKDKPILINFGERLLKKKLEQKVINFKLTHPTYKLLLYYFGMCKSSD